MVDVFSAIELITRLSLVESVLILGPLLVFAMILLAYFAVIFALYQTLAKRDPFRIVKNPQDPLAQAAYMLEYVFLFPIITFFWVLILTITISIPAQSTIGWFLYKISMEHILLVVTGMTVALRISAYVDERMSKEIARLIPLNFLTVVLIELPGIPLDAPVTVINSLPNIAVPLIYYFFFLFAMEFALRTTHHFRSARIEHFEQKEAIEEEKKGEDIAEEFERVKLELEALKEEKELEKEMEPKSKGTGIFKPLETDEKKEEEIEKKKQKLLEKEKKKKEIEKEFRED